MLNKIEEIPCNYGEEPTTQEKLKDLSQELMKLVAFTRALADVRATRPDGRWIVSDAEIVRKFLKECNLKHESVNCKNSSDEANILLEIENEILRIDGWAVAPPVEQALRLILKYLKSNQIDQGGS